MGSVVQTGPYDTANYILDLTRVLINDAAQSLDGALLSNTQPYTFTYLNSAYRDVQDELNNRGVETFANTVILTQIPAVPGDIQNDPATETYLSYDGFFDGESFSADIVLPSDLILPLRLEERASGTLGGFYPVQQAPEGLPGWRPPSNYLRVYDYRLDRLYFKGATQAIDLRLRYMIYLPDLVDGNSLVQINRVDRALASFTAAEFANARGSQMADTFRDKGMTYIDQIANRTQRLKQRGARRRRPVGTSGLSC